LGLAEPKPHGLSYARLTYTIFYFLPSWIIQGRSMEKRLHDRATMH
jgi:hypothetical protein